MKSIEELEVKADALLRTVGELTLAQKVILTGLTTAVAALCSESMLNRWYNQAITTTYRML